MFDLKDVEIIELHGFSDASLKAYAAVICIRFKLKYDSYCVNFVASKTKINPIQRQNNSKISINGMCAFESTIFSVCSSLRFN